jgi:pinin/SDK/memA/ protein conserved region
VPDADDAKKIKREHGPADSTDSTTAQPSVPSSDSHQAKPPDVKEKRRINRLFGNVLSGLRGNKTAAEKKREDAERKQKAVERRQSAKLKEQEAEVSQAQKEKIENLKAIRVREQKKLDYENARNDNLVRSREIQCADKRVLLKMRAKHSAMRSKAQHLWTSAQPSVVLSPRDAIDTHVLTAWQHYKPHELLPEQEDEILSQQAHVEEKIKRELEELKNKHGTDENGESNGQESCMKKPETNGAKTAAPRDNGEMKESQHLNPGSPNAAMAHTNGGIELNDKPGNDVDEKHTERSPPPTTAGAEISDQVQHDHNHEVSEQDHEHDHEMVVETAEDTVIY